MQEKTESPSAFLQWMMDSYYTYTPLDTEAPEHQMAGNAAFADKAVLDIKKKFQCLHDFEGKTMSELVAKAIKVYNVEQCERIDKSGDWLGSF